MNCEISFLRSLIARTRVAALKIALTARAGLRPSPAVFMHGCVARAWAAALITGALFLTACGTPMETPAPVRLSLAADRSALTLANDLAAAYHAAHPYISVDVEPMGNALAAREAVRKGHADLALSTVRPDPVNPMALRTEAIAQDSIALIVHLENPLTGMDLPQAAAIFHGDLRDWSQLGGEPNAIQVLTREPEAGPRIALEQAVLDDQTLTPMAIVVPGEQELLDFVANDGTAIGLLPASWLNGSVKALRLNGLSPDMKTRQPGIYPVLLPILLLSSDKPTEDVVEFRRFVQSREGQRVIGKHLTPATDNP